MQLADAKAGQTVTIVSNNAHGKAFARLNSLGLMEGQKLRVLSSGFPGLIVDIKGSRLAICKSAARDMEVSL